MAWIAPATELMSSVRCPPTRIGRRWKTWPPCWARVLISTGLCSYALLDCTWTSIRDCRHRRVHSSLLARHPPWTQRMLLWQQTLAPPSMLQPLREHRTAHYDLDYVLLASAKKCRTISLWSSPCCAGVVAARVVTSVRLSARNCWSDCCSGLNVRPRVHGSSGIA